MRNQREEGARQINSLFFFSVESLGMAHLEKWQVQVNIPAEQPALSLSGSFVAKPDSIPLCIASHLSLPPFLSPYPHPPGFASPKGGLCTLIPSADSAFWRT